ncbi:MAG: bifunctional phosphoglucose/phosphomannose isomerase [Chloroflexi bacterium]|nr:bifunctional phosphoglucose/phosphomannose isomerase [Chloroflexota bacterium]
MVTDLDDADAFRRLDPEDMLRCIRELPQQCRDAWAYSAEFALPPRYRYPKDVVVLGMGGSAIGGSVLSDAVRNCCPVPVLVNRDYTLPAFVDQQTLAIACSYSGDTEETLCAFEDALARQSMVAVISGGGALSKRAVDLGIPLWPIRYVSQPRAALGYFVIPLLSILHKSELIPDPGTDFADAVAEMEALQSKIDASVPTAANPAKQLALKLHGRVPIIYGAEHLTAAARRWKGQLNENAKSWSFFEVIPELNHNSVAGYRGPDWVQDKFIVIGFASDLFSPRNQVRLQVTQEMLAEFGVPCVSLKARGKSILAQILSTIYFGDYVSYYLAMLYGVHPSPVDNITALKKRLRAS